MNKIFNKQYLLATALFVAMGVMTGCGDDDSVPAPEQTQKENNSSSNESNNQQQEQIPEVKVIESSAIEENVDEGDVSVRMAEQSGGRAVLIVLSIAETKAASQIQIVGTYDNEKGCYTFNLSTLETGINYQYIISVFNQKGQKVMESKPKSLTIPESADIDKDGSDGGADGMKGGAVIVKD